MLRKVFFPILAVGLLSVTANAATISLDLQASGGTFQLFADDTLDNGGIASFNVPIQNIATLTNESPWYQANQSNFSPAGFSDLRNPATDGDTVIKTLGGSEHLLPTATPNLVYGFGQTGGDLPGAFFGSSKNPTGYGAHLLLGSGTYDVQGAAPSIDFQAANLSILVFSANTGTAVVNAEVIPASTPSVPEPATLSLLGLAMVGGLGLVRRRHA